MPPALIIRERTLEEEYNQARYVLKKMSWYKKHGYNATLPTQPQWQALAEESRNIDSDHIHLAGDTQIEQPTLTSQATPEEQAVFQRIDSPEIHRLFEKEEYNKDFFQPGLQKLKEQQYLVEKALQKFSELQKKWRDGFKIFPSYELTLTRYGTGGSYDENIGQVIIKTRTDGTLARTDPYITAIHEMVHIGIEKDIVRKYKLTQDEKERLVDRICMTQFPDIIKGYRMRQAGALEVEAIDAYLTQSGAMDNLPDTIERYVQEHPRDKAPKGVSAQKSASTYGIAGGTESQETLKPLNTPRYRTTGKLPPFPG